MDRPTVLRLAYRPGGRRQHVVKGVGPPGEPFAWCGRRHLDAATLSQVPLQDYLDEPSADCKTCRRLVTNRFG